MTGTHTKTTTSHTKTMRFVILLLYIVALSAAKPSLDEWNKFKTKFGKQYKKRSEEKYRRSVFNKNLKLIKKHNEDHDKGLVTYTLKMNSFGDMTNEEMMKRMTGLNPREEKPCTRHSHIYHYDKREKLPESVDWVKKGAVTAARNQSPCGCCYAFAAIGAIEGQQYLASKKLVNLSEQQVVDCSVDFNNDGCHGGAITKTFKYFKYKHGVNLQDVYPYEGKHGVCRYDPSSIGAIVTDLTAIPVGDEHGLTHALAKVGPIAVSIYIDPAGPGMFYGNGILHEKNCPPSFNHAVVAVGYGTLNGKKYYLLKNSWGTDWGDDGFFKMPRDHNSHCGIANASSYPHVKLP